MSDVPPRQLSSATLKVEVEGSAIPDDLVAMLGYAFVEDNLNLPDMFLLEFHEASAPVAVEKGHFALGKKVKVSLLSESNTSGEQIFIGEVTALEREFDGEKTRTVVRGFDKGHRLYRSRRTRAFVDMTYADIVKQVAADAGLQAGSIDSTSPSHKHVYQPNLTDGEFLYQLAREVGYVLEVDDTKVNFKKPPEASGAPAGGTLRAQPQPLQLTYGDNLLTFNVGVTADGQAKDVVVRSWDYVQKKKVEAKQPLETVQAKVDGDEISPAKIAEAFGNETVHMVEVPYADEPIVSQIAKAQAERMGSSFAQIVGVARGNPAIKAGEAISLGNVGKPFDGKYTVTKSRHIYQSGSYKTHFECTGAREASLQSLASGGLTAGDGMPGVIPGAVSAIVSNVDDPDKLGRVKVKIPRYDDQVESDWLRVLQPGSGNKRGWMLLPEVDDEVLVVFESGDVRRGYVLGGVYNGVDKPEHPHATDAVASGKVEKRSFTSRKGHFLLFHDKDGDEFVQVATKDDKFSLKMAKDAEGGTILMVSDKLIKINAKGDIEIKGDANILIDAKTDLTLKAQNIKVQAQQTISMEAQGGDVMMKGLNVKAEGQLGVAMEGLNLDLKGKAKGTLDGGGLLEVKGGLVKIN